MMRKGIDVFRDADGRTLQEVLLDPTTEVEIDVDNKHKVFNRNKNSKAWKENCRVSKLLAARDAKPAKTEQS